jgi:hypothetical protein
MRVALLATVVVAALASACHLADDPEVNCPPGTHADLGRCVADKDDGPTISITAAASGAACPANVAPASLTVGVNALFRFKNVDAVDHVIRGVDGQTWATAKAGEHTDFLALARAGTWEYDVDGCAKVGAIVVE